MKLFICLSSVIFLNFSVCFIPYPFISDSWLEPFLDILHDSIENSESAPQLTYSDESIWSRGEDCNRECKKNDTRICYFDFTMKYFQVMGG